ncbi:FtsX-like permease family protein [Ruminococcaceae bacterium OttesenSCG-928-L11]|nr:FtsX-like permease family protein [Ruminococcaceae bacterium OttesenSCG-928-L11]
MTLLKQALRSMWRGRKSYLACIVLMAVGIATFVSFNQLFANLTAAMESMYTGQRFADAFAAVKEIPLSAVKRLEEVPGVARVDATIVTDARILDDTTTKIVTLRIASFDPAAPQRLNDFILDEGALPTDGGILLGNGFAAANGLTVGDTLSAVLDGRKLELTVTGIVQSPEYVYVIPDASTLFPDDRTFGFAYMEASRLGTLTGKTGSATNLAFQLEEGVAFSSVQYALEDLLAPYGLRSLYDRKDQPSHAMLKTEVDSIGSMSSSLPLMFVFIAVIILYIMLKRIIEQERMQIGTLKAFGFGDRAILGHYLLYGAVTGLAGGVVGLALGLLMTDGMSSLYLEYFKLPAIRVPPNPLYLLAGLGLALASGLAGALMGTRSILRLDPAEAMRPPSPPAVHRDIVGRIPVLRAILASHGYMAMRNITRNRFRSAFVVLGMAFAFALTAFMASMGELFDDLLLSQFTKAELFNLKISLNTYVPYGEALESGYSFDGVRKAEAALELPVGLRNEHLSDAVAITGIPSDSALYKLYDSDKRAVVPLPGGGMVVSSSVAENLKLRRGDTVTVTTPYTGNREFSTTVLDVVNTNLGGAAYMQLDSLWELVELPPAVSVIVLDAENPAAIKKALTDADNVAAVMDNAETMQTYVDLLDSYMALIYMMQLCGTGVAFVIITNTASISLSERKREYATMRVLGMHPREIGRVVGFEYWVLSALSLPFGILLTRLFKESMGGMIDNDLFSMPVYTAPSSYAMAAVFCGAAVLLSNLLAGRRIGRFDMVEVLKERE